MTESPIRCEECKGTFLEPLADVKWDRERGEWVAQWVQLSEGYCFDCGGLKQFEENKGETDATVQSNLG